MSADTQAAVDHSLLCGFVSPPHLKTSHGNVHVASTCCVLQVATARGVCSSHSSLSDPVKEGEKAPATQFDHATGMEKCASHVCACTPLYCMCSCLQTELSCNCAVVSDILAPIFW